MKLVGLDDVVGDDDYYDLGRKLIVSCPFAITPRNKQALSREKQV